MSTIKLELKDCLDDTPQTRALIGVFQDDADVLTKYARGLAATFQRISAAQSELTSATRALSQHLREFEIQNFTLMDENDHIRSTMNQLAAKIDQVATFNAVLHTQVAENSVYQSVRFVQEYLAEYQNMKQKFQSDDKIHQEAMKKSSKLSKKRVNEILWQECSDHLHAARKEFHNTSMTYCSTLNLLQARKKICLLQPLIGYIQSQIGFFKMGSEIDQPELDEYLNKLTEDIKDLDINTSNAEKENLSTIDRIDAESTRAYIPDPPPGMDFPELPIPTKMTQISGYLYVRSRVTLLIQWNQRYYFTQGGNLMQQGRDEVAGGLVMDLDGSFTSLLDTDDRRYVFQVTAQDKKHSVTLQAESKYHCLQWVATLNNISKGLYLANDPTKAVELMQAASQPVEQPHEVSNMPVVTEPKHDGSSGQNASEFESKHEAFRPSVMFERIRSAASSLMAPSPKPAEPEKTNRNVTAEGDRISQQTTDSELEAVINSGFPILFDLPSPSLGQQSTSDNAANDGSDVQQSGVSGSPTRTNPFSGEADGAPKDENSEADAAGFKAMYVVRFIGCKQVDDVLNGGYGVISDSIRSIMAARALHNIFSMNELHLVVTDNAIQLIDPATQLVREFIYVRNILQAANHRENTRLFGFIVKLQSSAPTSTDDINMCYAFESNSDGADVCCAIATAQVMVQSKIEHEETQRQKELESDLEAQSKMLAEANTVAKDESAVPHDENESAKSEPDSAS